MHFTFCNGICFVTLYAICDVYDLKTVLELLHCVQLRFVTLRHVTFTLCCFTLCSNIPIAIIPVVLYLIVVVEFSPVAVALSPMIVVVELRFIFLALGVAVVSTVVVDFRRRWRFVPRRH
jgi:hypothetical protein